MKSDLFLQEKDPLKLLSLWLKEAQQTRLKTPGAFVLTTVDPQGQPSSRVVLEKGVSEKGVVFYTSYSSKKAEHLNLNPQVSANFFWDELGRQVRLKGRCTALTREQNESYWASRPRDSQIAQWVSLQSQPVKDRETMEARFQQAESEFLNREVPCPESWGGYQLEPTEMEFWVADPRRFHDRFLYMKVEDYWENQRLWP